LVAEVEALLNAGADVNAQDDEGFTALMEASQFGHEDAVMVLLRAEGINVDSKERYGWTALMLACSRGRLGVVHLLLAANADIYVRDDNGENAFNIAYANEHFEIAQAIADHGFDEEDEDDVDEAFAPSTPTNSESH
jgi:ankyrin repeat protein